MLLNKKKSNPNTGYPVENYRNPIMVWLLSISFYHPKVNIKNCNKIVKERKHEKCVQIYNDLEHNCVRFVYMTTG